MGFLKECFDLSVRNVPLDFTPYSSDSKILSEMYFQTDFANKFERNILKPSLSLFTGA